MSDPTLPEEHLYDGRTGARISPAQAEETARRLADAEAEDAQ